MTMVRASNQRGVNQEHRGAQPLETFRRIIEQLLAAH